MNDVIRHLSDQDLLIALGRANDRTRAATVDFLQHLAEVDARRLYLPEACASMFTYCVERLRLAEGAAHRRIVAARAGRRYPVIFDMLRRGDLHLTGVAMLAPLLTVENHESVLARARHRTTRALEVLVAELAPRPDGPDVVRRLPAVSSSAGAAGALRATPDAMEMMTGASRTEGSIPRPSGPLEPPMGVEPRVPAAPARSPLAMSPPPRVQPTAPDRYRISFTGDRELADLLTEVRDLLGHRVAPNDLASVIKRGLLSLRGDLLRQRTGRTKRQLAATAAEPGTGSSASAQASGVAGVTSVTAPAPGSSNTPLESAAVGGGDGSGAVATAPDSAAVGGGDGSGAVSTAPDSAAVGAGQGEVAGATGQLAVEKPSVSRPASRHVPNEMRRQVWARDGGRCTFVNESGDRCSETSALELDHLRPYGRHGEHNAVDIVLRCRQHNQWTAELAYGAAHMARFRRRKARGPSTNGPT